MWDDLAKADKPVVLYGTGNAAEKILNELDARSIRVSGIFASDGFVRSREFAGLTVTDYGTAKETFGDMTVLLCFGSHRPEVMENIVRIAGEQDLYAPDLPVAGGVLFDREFYGRYRDRLSAVREKLADDRSRLVFDKVIEYKLGGRIGPLLECGTPEEDNWRLFLRGEENGRAECAAASAGTAECPESNGDPEAGALFADLGAYTGDTVKLYRKIRACADDAIIAFEPEPRNFRKLSENLGGLGNAELINAAAWDSDGEAFFEKGRGRGTRAELSDASDALPGSDRPGTVRTIATPPGTIRTQLRSLDSVLDGRRADFIKMDIEGAEGRAIQGAARTIKDFRPRMLIAAYHRSEDLFAIPEAVLSMRPDYRLYLRKDPAIPAWGVNYVFL